jgi:signal peptidase II
VSSEQAQSPPNLPKSITSWKANQGPAIAGILSLAIDIASKTWARQALLVGQVKPFFPPLIRFSLVTNTGAAFSVGSDNGPIVLIIATGVFLLLLFWYHKKMKRGFESRLEQYGLAIVIGAALGNLLDRYLYHRVTDFLEFTFINFPVFNFADIMIDVGIVLIILSTLLQPRVPPEKTSAE